MDPLIGKGLVCRNEKHVMHIGEVTGKLSGDYYLIALHGIDGTRRYEVAMNISTASYRSTQLGQIYFFPSLADAIRAADIPGRLHDPEILETEAKKILIQEILVDIRNKKNESALVTKMRALAGLNPEEE
jgi:hypothetical protein